MSKQDAFIATGSDFFNQKDVQYLLDKLTDYDDLYTDKLKEVLNRYMQHKDFETLHNELEDIDSLLNRPFHLIWDMQTRIGFMDVIYPV